MPDPRPVNLSGKFAAPERPALSRPLQHKLGRRCA
jgi:hypothetical protein